MKWIRKNLNINIEFPVIADDMGKIVCMLGMIHPKKGINTVRVGLKELLEHCSTILKSLIETLMKYLEL